MQSISKFTRALLILTCALAVGAAAYPAKSVTPDKFAADVCTAMRDWVQSLKQGAADYQQQLQTVDATNLPTVRDSITGYIETTVTKTDRLIATLRAIGAPNTPKGKRAAKSLLTAFSRIRDAFAAAKGASQRVSTTDIDRFKTDAQGIERQINTASDRFGQSFSSRNGLDPNHKLERAFKRQAACKTLGT